MWIFKWKNQFWASPWWYGCHGTRAPNVTTPMPMAEIIYMIPFLAFIYHEVWVNFWNLLIEPQTCIIKFVTTLERDWLILPFYSFFYINMYIATNKNIPLYGDPNFLWSPGDQAFFLHVKLSLNFIKSLSAISGAIQSSIKNILRQLNESIPTLTRTSRNWILHSIQVFHIYTLLPWFPTGGPRTPDVLEVRKLSLRN